MKNISFGIPLILGLGSTIGSLFLGNKKLHGSLGIIFSLFAMLHFFSHKNKVKKDFVKGINKMKFFDALNFSNLKLDLFLKSITVKSFIPGRIRIYSKSLVGSEEKKIAVLKELGKHKELDSVSVNTITGSVLIEYDPLKIKSNKKLLEIENMLLEKYKKR